MKGSRVLYAMALVAVALAAVIYVIKPKVMQIALDIIVDGVSGTEFTNSLWACCAAYFGVTVANGVASFIRTSCATVASENMAKGMKDKLYDHLQKLPYDYHVKAKTGDLIQRCTSDVDTVRRFLSGQFIDMMRAFAVVLFSAIMMLAVSVKMTLVAVVLLPLILIFSYAFFMQVRKQFKKSDEKEGELSTVLQENLSGVRVVRAFGREKYETDKFQDKNDSLTTINKGMMRTLAYYWSISDVICFAQIALVLFFGIYETANGNMTLGEFVMFNTYVQMQIWPVRQLGRILSDMGKMQVALTRIYEVLDTPEEQETPNAKEYPLDGDIVFKDVRFEYETGKPVLKGLSFTVKSGETIAVLGSTGSGKSTLMHILLRLYDYKDGSVTIGGQELRTITKQQLRSRIGMVLQEPFLFSKTIRENLRMAKDEVVDDEIYTATRTAAVHDVIEEFEQGYETILGEKGVTLSGGQKQRVAIARTLIKDSDILIFDDSLSAVDTETDAQIRAALANSEHKATTFIISQRITTLMSADRIFVIEDGRLTDSGTHQELLSREGLYSRIWNIQSMLEDSFTQERSAQENSGKEVSAHE